MRTQSKSSKDTDMTKGPIVKLLVMFSIPLLLGNLFQQLYNTVDSLVVGNFVGTQALAAIGSTTNICNTLVKFFNGVSIGASVIISQYYGAHDEEDLYKSVQTTMALTFLCGVIFTVVGYSMTPFMLQLMATPEDVLQPASTYLRIYFLGISGLLVYNMGSGILRAVGDSRRPLMFLIFSSIMNIILDLLFVLAFNMGIAGVAWATIISQFVSAFLILVLLSRCTESYRFDIKGLRLDWYIVKRILVVGLPTGIQQSLTAFSNVFVYSYINAFGSACMAGWSCYNKIDQFIFLPMQSIGSAATMFVGQNVGAKDVKRAKKGSASALTMAILFTAACCLVLWIFAPQMVSLFNRDTEVLYYGVRALRMNLCFLVFCCFNQVLAGALRGIGDAKTPMYFLLFSQVLMRQIYLFIISRVFPGNFYVVSFAFPFGWMLCSALMLHHYLRMDWDKLLEKNK